MINKIKRDVREALQKTLVMKAEEMDKLKDDDDLENIGLNSVLLLQFIVELEQRLKIEIDEESINNENFGSINSIANYIVKIRS